MARAKNKKTTVKKIITDEIVIEPESILTTDEVKELNKDEIIDVVVIENEKHNEEPIVMADDATAKEDATVCRVVLATPTYYVIVKNGVTITVNEKNNYRRGEEIVR